MTRFFKVVGMSAAAGLIVALFIFPVYQAWINEFQTLIAGVTAACAAALTISKMEKTIRVMEKNDEASELRHRELVELSLRADKARVERMLFPGFGSLRYYKDTLKETQLPDIWADPDSAQKLQDISEVLSPIATAIIEILESEQWRAGENLLGGILTYRIAALKSTAYELREATRPNQDAVDDAEREAAELERQRERRHIPVIVMRLIARLEEANKDLFALSDQYKLW